MFDTVLFPIDNSRQTMETAGKVIQLAQQHGSRVVLLAVVEEEEEGGAMHEPASVTQLLEQARASFEEAGLDCDAFERPGKPAFVIGDVAEEVNADLIVMCTLGLTLEEDQHSTAARVIQLAPCPVMVVP
ncbi:MAG: universal stress protein [Cyanobacteriota bacterium]